jgi:FAD/FMN-containing dehydrogenase
MISHTSPRRINLNFSPEDVTELRSNFIGRVVLPDDSTYDASRQGYIKTYQQFPQIIGYCEISRDVAKCLRFAREHKLEVTCRSGGHSTAGYSGNSGMVIDLSRMNHVFVEPAKKQATVGAGATFEKINACLDQYKLHVPGAGGCAYVGLGGYVQGGGYGFSSLMYGMSSDNVTEIVVMLADGLIVRADDKQHSRLFWALRGGTGNNFGVVLEVTYKLQNLWKLWGFGIRWDIEFAPAVLVEMQRSFTGDKVPANLGYQCFMEWVDRKGATDRKPVLQMRGIFNGSDTEGKRVLSSLLETKGVCLEISEVGKTYEYLNNFLLQDRTEAVRLPPQVREEVDSRYVATPLEEAGWQEVTEAFSSSPNDGNMIGLEPYGGRINCIAPDATAFVHRTASFNVYCWVMWLEHDERLPAIAFLDNLICILSKYTNGEANQNYPRRSNKDYRSMYWGANFEKLLKIKHEYDPGNVFRYEQSVAD